MRQDGVVYIGVDVSKDTLDIDAGDLGASRIRNAPADIRRALAALARKADPGTRPHVCFEHTGPYTAALAAACQAQALPHSILNPYKVSCFAKAVASAKTDRIDAAVIRRFAESGEPEPAPPPSKARAGLDELIAARDLAVRGLAACRALLATLTSPCAIRRVRRDIAAAGRSVAGYGRLIGEAVAADGELAGLTAALETVKGVGALTAARLAAWMPELGALGRRRAAKLAGLAPYTRQSGKWKGHTWIGGGRKRVRDALFMPATVARTHDPHLRRIYDGLRARGKPYKVAMTAVMRRFICHLDAVARAYYAGRGDAKA